MKNANTQNIGARWLRNGADGGKQSWATKGSATTCPGGDHGGATVTARFMEIDGQVGEILGEVGAIRCVQRESGNKSSNSITLNTEEIKQGGNEFENEVVVLESKRKRVEDITELDETEPVIQLANTSKYGPKNLLEAGPGAQARLDK